MTEKMEHYCRVCRTTAPYPLNYLPSGDPRQQMLGAVVGLLIEKGMFEKNMGKLP